MLIAFCCCVPACCAVGSWLVLCASIGCACPNNTSQHQHTTTLNTRRLCKALVLLLCQLVPHQHQHRCHRLPPLACRCPLLPQVQPPRQAPCLHFNHPRCLPAQCSRPLSHSHRAHHTSPLQHQDLCCPRPQLPGRRVRSVGSEGSGRSGRARVSVGGSRSTSMASIH